MTIPGFDELTFIEELEPQPELAPADQARMDAWNRTPDYTRMAGCPVYRNTLVKELLAMAAPACDQLQSQHGLLATGLSFEDAWAMSGAPDGSGEIDFC